MESWQSGNAPDSKSGEPMLNGRAGSNPVLSFYVSVNSVKLSKHGEPRMLLKQRSRLFLLLFSFVGLRIISVNFDYGWVPLGSR